MSAHKTVILMLTKVHCDDDVDIADGIRVLLGG